MPVIPEIRFRGKFYLLALQHNDSNMSQLPSLGADFFTPEEPPAFEWVNRGGNSPLVLLCDHASNRVPSRLQNLGLNAAQLSSHIGWDPGAAEVARALSIELDAPLILSNYSRVVIDCNRPLSSPESIPEISAQVNIPGNQALTPSERQARIDCLFHPYHQAITGLLDERQQGLGLTPVNGQQAPSSLLLSIHSFTPLLAPAAPRPWHMGVAFRRDPRLADALYAILRQDASLCVGYNQPYDIDDHYDYSVPVHGEERGLPCAMIELRQDGLQDRHQTQAWAHRLAKAYQAVAPYFEIPPKA